MRANYKKKLKKTGYEWIDAQSERLIEHSRRIWNYAELGFEEKKSAQAHVNFLKEEGFGRRR